MTDLIRTLKGLCAECGYDFYRGTDDDPDRCPACLFKHVLLVEDRLEKAAGEGGLRIKSDLRVVLYAGTTIVGLSKSSPLWRAAFNWMTRQDEQDVDDAAKILSQMDPGA